MKENPANIIKDTMWHFLMDGAQKGNVQSLKEYVYDLIKVTTQKDAGQRKSKGNIPWEELDMTCAICGRRLKSLRSRELGYGPVCCKKAFGKPITEKGKHGLQEDGDIPCYDIPGQMTLDDYL